MSNDNNNHHLTISQNGNLTKVQHGAPSPATASPLSVPQDANRVSGGALRLNMGFGEVTQVGVTKYTTGQDRDTSSVSATLQRVNGVDTVELIPGNSASRTNIKQAIADGLIEPVGPGLWRDKVRNGGTAGPAAAAVPPAAALQEQPQADPGAGVFNPDDDAAWNADIEPLPQHAYDASLASVTVAVLSGADSLDAATTKLAEQAAISKELAAQYTEHGYNMYEAVVAKEVAKAGIDPREKQAFYTWAREYKGKALHHAIQSLTLGRDVSKFVHLAHEYRTRSNRG